MPEIYYNIPEQQRSEDPFLEDRYTSIINMLTRFVSGGEDVLLTFDEEEFSLNKISDTRVKIGTGLFIKDDVLIEVEREKILNFNDNENYIGESGLDREGNYLIVLTYNYSRDIPIPVAYVKIIKDKKLYYHNKNEVIFLGVANIVNDGGVYKINHVDVKDYEEKPIIKRMYPVFRPNKIDGGILEDES